MIFVFANYSKKSCTFEVPKKVGYLHTTIAITIATTIAMETTVYHIPALLNESIEGLALKPDGNYVDATFGGGGHSRAILSH